MRGTALADSLEVGPPGRLLGRGVVRFVVRVRCVGRVRAQAQHGGHECAPRSACVRRTAEEVRGVDGGALRVLDKQTRRAVGGGSAGNIDRDGDDIWFEILVLCVEKIKE